MTDEYWNGLPDCLAAADVARILRIGTPAALARLRRGAIPGYRIASSWIVFTGEFRTWLEATSNGSDAPRRPRLDADPLDDYPDELNYRDLMRLFGKTKQTVYVWLRNGEIPAYHVGGRWVVHKPRLRARLAEASNGPDTLLSADPH